jgi:hypothetical protein
VLLEIFRHLDPLTLRCAAQVCKGLHLIMMEYLKPVRYFRLGYAYVGDELLHTTANPVWVRVNPVSSFPSFIAMKQGLMKRIKINEQDANQFVMFLPAEIDTTCVNSRSWWPNEIVTNLPLPPLEIAREWARKKKEAEFAAMLKDAAKSGLLADLLKDSKSGCFLNS